MDIQYVPSTSGMAEAISSTTYAIGYTSLHSAVDGQVDIAHIINKAGSIVKATTHSIQVAMDFYKDKLSERLTTSLVDCPHKDAYPFASYTYLIVQKHLMKDCTVAVELYRYIMWILSNKQAEQEANHFYMASITKKVSQAIIDEVIKVS